MKHIQISRRNFLIKSSGIILPSIPMLGRPQEKNDPYIGSKEEMEIWMQEASLNKSVSGILKLGRFSDPYYFTLDEIKWIAQGSDKGNLPDEAAVPTGFVTDLASIPRPFWSLMPRDGNYVYAAIIHDYLYWNQKIEKNIADKIFKAAMEDFNIESTTVEIIYNAVSFFGAKSWDNNLIKKNQGEKRIIKKFPENPAVKWIDWKLNDIY